MARDDRERGADRADPELWIMVAYLRTDPDVIRQLARFRAPPGADAAAVREEVLWQAAAAWRPRLCQHAAFRRFRWWWAQENPGDRAGGG